MEDLTRTVLKDLAHWKRTGILPTQRSCCREDHCICADAHHPYSLRDHATHKAAYDAAVGVTLRVLTMDEPVPLPDPCDGTYLCECAGCRDQRADLLKRRPVRQPWVPVKRAA